VAVLDAALFSISLATQSLSWKQAVPSLIIVVALFFAYAAEYFAPESWLGLRIRTMEGKFWLLIFIWLSLYSIGIVIRSLRETLINSARNLLE
jgi:hypothetical protein